MKFQNKSLEKYLQNSIFPELEKGRKGWDLEHTKAVVYYAKKLLEHHPEIDPTVLITAAYAHDIGYTGLFKKDQSLQKILNKKDMHMQKGAEMIEILLKERSDLTKTQKERIKHLVYVHDRLDSLSDTDELVLMEADTLGALDTDFVSVTFSKAENDRYLKRTAEARLPLFITKEAKILFEENYKKRASIDLPSKH